eukprot:g59549.t1
MARMFSYLDWVAEQEWRRLDESSFRNYKLYRRRCRSQRCLRVAVGRDMTEESDLSYSAIQLGLLVRGDILVLDNAKIHHAQETTPLLTLLFNLLGIEMRFLPTYSPEFNPCELIFHMAKQHIKNNRGDDRFFVKIFCWFAAGCDKGKVIKSYRKCIP